MITTNDWETEVQYQLFKQYCNDDPKLRQAEAFQHGWSCAKQQFSLKDENILQSWHITTYDELKRTTRQAERERVIARVAKLLVSRVIEVDTPEGVQFRFKQGITPV